MASRLVCAVAPTPTAVTLGLRWLGLGIVYLLVLTRGLRIPPPEFRLDDPDAPAERAGHTAALAD